MENEQPATPDIRDIVRHAIQEFVQAEQRENGTGLQSRTAGRAKRREGLEGRVNQLVEENRKARADG